MAATAASKTKAVKQIAKTVTKAAGSEEQNPPSKKKATKEVAKAVKGKGRK